MSNKINSEEADNLWKMLSSKDDASIELAFGILEDANFDDSETYFHVYNLIPTILTIRYHYTTESLVNKYFDKICAGLVNSSYAKEFD